MKINFEKLKSVMDDDGDFIIDEIISANDVEPYEEILIIRTGDEFDEDYRISVEKHIEDEDDYDVIEEFGSDIKEIEYAVDCYIENGGSIETFKSFSS